MAFPGRNFPCFSPPVDSEPKADPELKVDPEPVEMQEIWKEGPENLRPRLVSRDFIDGLRAAGARESLTDALDKQWDDWEKSL